MSASEVAVSPEAFLDYFKPTYHEHRERYCKEIEAVRFNPAQTYLEQFAQLCDYYYQRLNMLPPTHSILVTRANARMVNAAQSQWLKRQHLSRNPVELEGFLRNHLDSISDNTCNHLASSMDRTIVPYFREPIQANHGDVDPFGFGVSVYALQRLIQEQRTRVFTQLTCVSRHSQYFPQYLIGLFGPQFYDPCEEQAFFARTVIGANIIHYAHGNPYEQVIFGAVPILATSVRKDQYRMHKIGANHVPLHLLYDQNNQNVFKDWSMYEPNFANSISGIMQESIRALGELEKLLLARAKSQEVIVNTPCIENMPAKSRLIPDIKSTFRTIFSSVRERIESWMPETNR